MSTAVLLAETEPATRSFLERHLVDDGFEVVAAERARDGRPDLVLLGDSRQVSEWAGEVPVIVLGGDQADVIDRVRAFARGCDDYLSEPFMYEELVGVFSYLPENGISHFPAVFWQRCCRRT
jgi:DNA-binding response OmpR family regulator